MNSDLTSRVIQIVARFASVPVQQIKPETQFDALGIDSLMGLDLIADLEEAFGVVIPNNEALKIRTVGQAAESLRRGMAESQPTNPPPNP